MRGMASCPKLCRWRIGASNHLRDAALRVLRRLLFGNLQIPDCGEDPLAMFLPGALDAARVDVGHHVGVAQRQGNLLLEVVRQPVGVLQEVLAADDDVEVHVLLRAGASRAEFVIVDHEGPVAVDEIGRASCRERV